MDYYGTIGPACASAACLRRMREAGMTGIRVNLSHGTLENQQEHLALIREAGIPKILIDLQGPELRIGDLTEPLELPEGAVLRLGRDGVPCPAALISAVRKGQRLLLDDGKMEAEVEQAQPDYLLCTVRRGGVLRSRKSLAVPGVVLHTPTLTAEDRQNLEQARQYGVTGVMLPFVRGAEDLLTLRDALEKLDIGGIRIFAKIENREGVQALTGLLPYVDEVVIARGDLGNAMPLWELPAVQKYIAGVCRSSGVPFMVVTQLLDSMQTRAIPTRAEVCDVYNAALDGASSLMLTGETAVGQYPVEAMRYLVKTAQQAERMRGRDAAL